MAWVLWGLCAREQLSHLSNGTDTRATGIRHRSSSGLAAADPQLIDLIRGVRDLRFQNELAYSRSRFTRITCVALPGVDSLVPGESRLRCELIANGRVIAQDQQILNLER